ncbi:2496_t:CDS:2 [Dentiscutata heterogama]|uniref:2496_t:CDS:1 n=1 Tax=Dentiscutata heterogama TaxID=1316150 RepID=A0ACA9LWQ2_9GLOM|nr:2496_t:CDS:2 [Dentiscutata heterogama]
MTVMNMKTWIENYFHQMLDGFDDPLLKNMKIINTSSGMVKSEITVQLNHLNHIKTAHGGMLITLVDICGSLIIASKELNYSSGISTNINILFTNPAKERDVLFIEAECIKFGKAMRFADIKIYNKDNRKLIAQGRSRNHLLKQERESVAERKENSYTQKRDSKIKATNKLDPPASLLNKRNKNKENIKPNYKIYSEGALKSQPTQEDTVQSMLLQIIGRLDKLEDATIKPLETNERFESKGEVVFLENEGRWGHWERKTNTNNFI